MTLRDDPIVFLSGLVASLYAEAAAKEQVKGKCGFTPLEHFIKGEDGVYRLQTDHIHANMITAGNLTVPPQIGRTLNI